VVHSEKGGSVLFIPRERNMTRLYIELHPTTTEPRAAEVANEDFVMRRAAEILAPFYIKWKSIGKNPVS
jgi:phenol 2-monooxygenase (NADPH)